MADPLLSVCIATYNRAKFIGETLDGLIAQCTPEVEIVVVDGASTDDTAAVLGSYASRGVRYERLPAKGGVDHDFDAAVRLARGRFCWLFSDDDIVKPGAIDAVVAVLRSRDPSLIVVNGETRDYALHESYQTSMMPITDDTVLPPGQRGADALMAVAGSYLSFIGCVVIERELWLARDAAAYFGTEFVHVGVIFQQPLPKSAVILAHPYIALRLGNSQWSARAFGIWIVTWPRLIWSFTHHSAASRAAVCPQYPSQQVGKLLYYRALGPYSRTAYQTVVRPASPRSVARALAAVVAALPMWLAGAIVVVYARARHRPWMADALRQARLARHGG